MTEFERAVRAGLQAGLRQALLSKGRVYLAAEDDSPKSDIFRVCAGAEDGALRDDISRIKVALALLPERDPITDRPSAEPQTLNPLVEGSIPSSVAKKELTMLLSTKTVSYTIEVSEDELAMLRKLGTFNIKIPNAIHEEWPGGREDLTSFLGQLAKLKAK